MMTTQRIAPCLWFDDHAEEAARFYTSVFPNSKILRISVTGRQATRFTGAPRAAS
jgi:predicted 3-demethylubiquinone-9 3-methyltransferase (glyoxalase superfamily)